MRNDFNELIEKAIELSKRKSIGGIEEFKRTSQTAQKLLLRIYNQNPNITREEVKERMQQLLNDILEETVTIKDFESDIIRRNVISHLIRNILDFRKEYDMVLADERKTGEKLKGPERIVYSHNKQKAIKQIITQIVCYIRQLEQSEDMKVLENLQRFKPISKKEMRKILDGNDNKDLVNHIINLTGDKTEFEKVKYYLERVINLENTDFELKIDFMEAICKITLILQNLGVLTKYAKDQNQTNSRTGMPEEINIKEESEEKIGKQISDPQILKNLTISQLAALYSFWNNRLVKEIIDIYKSYFMMYELGLDNKDLLKAGDYDKKIDLEKFRQLNLKMNAIHIKAFEIYIKARKENVGGGKIYIEDQINEVYEQIGDEYKEFFSNIDGLEESENDFKEDFYLYFGLENATRNLYLQKDRSMIGILELLCNADISKNWGIFEDDPKTGFVLLVADIDGLNMPLRLHIKKSMIKDYILENQGNSIIPIYSGGEDFFLGGRNVGTSFLFPLNREQRNAVQLTANNMRSTDYRNRFVSHISFLTDSSLIPEHLTREKIVKKKGKFKSKREFVREAIDLETGQKYYIERGKYIPEKEDSQVR